MPSQPLEAIGDAPSVLGTEDEPPLRPLLVEVPGQDSHSVVETAGAAAAIRAPEDHDPPPFRLFSPGLTDAAAPG
jgi:hypothetical protein